MGTLDPPDLLPGTLELLILKTLTLGEMHGYGIARHLRTRSEDVLQVGESSLYPAPAPRVEGLGESGMGCL